MEVLSDNHYMTTDVAARFPIGAPYLTDWATHCTYDIFGDDEIEAIKNFELALPDYEPATVRKDGDKAAIDHAVRECDVNWLRPNPGNRWFYEKVGHAAQEANSFRWRCELPGFNEPLQYTRYRGEDNHHYEWHMDMGAGRLSLRKISFSLILQNAEEGGDFEIFTQQQILTLDKLTVGSLLFFPSYIMHRVTPIIRGERISIVGWLGGLTYK